MAESKKDKIKYGILKVIDVSGFKVFDPPVRLLFGEEPQKQIKDIGRYMLLPILFVLLCLGLWTAIGPNHKTKSGEVPTPMRVWSAFKDSLRFDEKEKEKKSAFLATGAKRDAEIQEVKALITTLEANYAILEKESKEVSAAADKTLASDLKPHQEKYDLLKAQYAGLQKERKTALEASAEKVASKQLTPEQLIEEVQKDAALTDTEKDELNAIKITIEEIRSNPPKEVKEKQLAANKVADEIQHAKKRIDFLTTGNRELKEQALQEKAATATAALSAATDGKTALKEAKNAFKNTEKAEKMGDSRHAKAASIVWQTYRSLVTVLIGFILAIMIAIPVGIMCGLNRIVMACLTPLISIFRPVSPVVWLLIFQIVIGAFFPDPEKHPLFVFLNANANPLSYFKTNPAMIFSACTVAMCALWPALVNTALGVSSIDPDHLNVAKVLRLGFWSRLFKIIIPSSLPLVFAGLRISLGVGWMVLIAAEALSSSDGLGKFVWDEYQNGSSQSFANIIVACFVVGGVGFLLDRIMIILQRFVSFDESASV